MIWIFLIKTKRKFLFHVYFSSGRFYVKEETYADGSQPKNDYKSYKKVINLDCNKYIVSRNKCLVSFLEGVAGMSFVKENRKIKIAAAVCIEQIYFLQNFTLVMPCHFLANLVQSYASGSKTVSVVNGKITPGGSYATLNEWMRSMGSTPLDSPNGDIDIYLLTLVDTLLKHTVLIAKNL